MQLVQQVQESLLPYMLYKWRKVKIVKKFMIDDYENKSHNISKAVLLYAERDATKEAYAVCSWLINYILFTINLY